MEGRQSLWGHCNAAGIFGVLCENETCVRFSRQFLYTNAETKMS